MMDFKSLWTPTGGLYAVAVAILIFVANMALLPHYQFAASSIQHTVWRGDTVTGHAVLCATDAYANGAEYSAGIKVFVTRC